MENNRLIAEFMGFKKVRVGYTGMRGRDGESMWQRKNAEWMDFMEITDVGEYGVDVENDTYFDWTDCAYDKDWNWLLEVVNKIKLIAGPDLVKWNNEISAVLMLTIDNDIKTVYDSVVEFIKWYKSNHPQP